MSKINIISELIQQNNVVLEAKSIVKNMYQRDKIPWVVGYSGGKDSTTTTQLIVESLIEMKESQIVLPKHVYVITSDTLVETPMIINTIKFTIKSINELADKHGLPISAHIVMPKFDQTFWVNVIGRGYPTPNQTFRWCTDRMKIDPANRFITEVIDKHGEAIMILGVRDGESNSRDRSIGNHSVEGKTLMRHATMANAYVFAPIRKFNIDNVWNYLLGNPSPWGANNQELYQLYSNSSAECPLIVDESIKREAGSCGNSRFGCWVCTVVKEDKSLSGFIESGEDWMRPMLEFRNWLYQMRDDLSIRMKRRNNGLLYFSKVKSIQDHTIVIPEKGGRKKITINKKDNKWFDQYNLEWTIFDGVDSEKDAKQYIASANIDLNSGENPRIIIKNLKDEYMQLGSGPYTHETRKNILRKLFRVQKNLDREQELIKREEILEIRKIWMNQGDWEDSASLIYSEIFNAKLIKNNEEHSFFDDEDMNFLNTLCKNEEFDFNTYYELLRNSHENMGYINRVEPLKKIKSLLSKEFLLFEGQADNNED